MNDSLTEDTKATLLLYGVFGKAGAERTLSVPEYTKLEGWLRRRLRRPKVLLQEENVIAKASIGSGIDNQRLEMLLDRGTELALAVEEWQRSGIWIISRSDDDYPKRYKEHLKDEAPPLLFGVGNRSLLSGGGLSIIGSRDIDQVGGNFTRQVAKLCADIGMPVVSRGDRGVGKISMDTALEAGGVTIGVLADNLLKKSVERNYRQAIADERLLLISPYHPNVSFDVGNAMGRNKLIYAMSDYSLIVSADYKKGGTWAGAEQELKRENSRPVYFRIGNVPKVNAELLKLGAKPCPDITNNFVQHLRRLAVNSETSATEGQPPVVKVKEDNPKIAEPKPGVEPEVKMPEHPESIYQPDLPLEIVDLGSVRIPRRRKDLVAWLKKNLNTANMDRIRQDDWGERCQDDFPTTACALMQLANEECYPIECWQQALQAWSDEKHAQRSWRYMAKVITKVPDEKIEDLALGISQWLDAIAPNFTGQEKEFLNLIIVNKKEWEDPSTGTYLTSSKLRECLEQIKQSKPELGETTEYKELFTYIS